ncbi:MAG: DNA-directed RNA polymerase subunit beta, partial [Fimbriimonadaceae bacterium]
MRVIQPQAKKISRFLEVPNLIELQHNSYRWFLEEGLPELFTTFSPIWDFTQTNYIELVSFSLGEPKYNIQDCRERDMTYEAPIKAIVRFGGKEREVIESEVYMGDLPLMTDKGTFIVNGRERVIVSQLSRSPGLYFEEGVDASMQVLVSARIIPNEGPWLEVESDSNLVVRTQISQTKKLPLTQLIKALSAFDKGHALVHAPLKHSVHRKLAEPVANEDGEVILENGTFLTTELLAGLPEEVLNKKYQVELMLSNNEELLLTFGRPMTIDTPKAEDLIGKRLTKDLMEGNKAVIKRLEKIEKETAKKIESMELDSIEILDVLPLADATLEQDPTTNWKEAILDIYKR